LLASPPSIFNPCLHVRNTRLVLQLTGHFSRSPVSAYQTNCVVFQNTIIFNVIVTINSGFQKDAASDYLRELHSQKTPCRGIEFAKWGSSKNGYNNPIWEATSR